MSNDDVSVRFGAQTSDFNAAVNSVVDKFRELYEESESFHKNLYDLGKTIASAFAVEKIASFTLGIGEAAEQLKRLTYATGLSSETIQIMQYAMEMTGGDAEAAGSMLMKFNSAVFDAASGSGGAYESFSRLGVSLNDLRTSSIDEIFRKSIDGFRGIRDTSESANIGVDLFGKGFLNIAPAAREGMSGLDKFGGYAKKVGDIMSPEMTDKLASIEDQSKKTGKAFYNLGRDIIAGIADPITETLHVVELFINALRNLPPSMTALQQAKQEDSRSCALLPMNKTAKNTSTESFDIEAVNRNLLGQQKAREEARKKAEDELKAAHDREFRALQDKWTRELMRNKQYLEDKTQQEIDYWNSVITTAKIGESQKLSIEKRIYDLETSIAKKQSEEHKKLAREQARVWEDAFRSIDRSFDTMTNGILMGTQSWRDAFRSMTAGMISSFAAAIATMTLKWAAFKVAKSQDWNQMAKGISDSAGGGGMFEQLAGAILSLLGATFISATSEDAGTVATTANTLSIDALTVAVGLNTAALETSAAMDFLPGFAVGTTNVPQDMVARIHKGEIIVPASQSEAIRSGRAALGGVPAVSASGGGDVHNWYVSAIDANGIKRFFDRNKDYVGAAATAFVRNTGRGLAGRK